MKGAIKLSLIRLAASLFAPLLFANEAMAGLDPSGTRGSMVEVKAAVSTPATIACPNALKGRLRRPGKGALFVGEAR
jgi:hypothetical protein